MNPTLYGPSAEVRRRSFTNATTPSAMQRRYDKVR